MNTLALPNRKTTEDMSESADAKKLATLLDQQRQLLESRAKVGKGTERDAIENELRSIRGECIELVDRYFRQVVHPILQKRFPRKVAGKQSKVTQKAPVNTVAQFTQLLNDFFVQVLDDPKFENPFWKKQTVIELRNYASITISNNGLIDALRRRKRQADLGDAAVRSRFEADLAIEVSQRFAESGVEPSDAVEIINDWETNGEPDQRQVARLLRLRYVAGMSMNEVAEDMGISLATAYRHEKNALTAIRAQLEANS